MLRDYTQSYCLRVPGVFALFIVSTILAQNSPIELRPIWLSSSRSLLFSPYFIKLLQLGCSSSSVRSTMIQLLRKSTNSREPVLPFVQEAIFILHWIRCGWSRFYWKALVVANACKLFLHIAKCCGYILRYKTSSLRTFLSFRVLVLSVSMEYARKAGNSGNSNR